MLPPLIAQARLDGPHHVWVTVGPDDDLRAEPLTRRTHALMQKALAGDAARGPTEPSQDIGVWIFSADTFRAPEVAATVRAFLASEGCVLPPERVFEPWQWEWE